jgi:hypothetical protein
MALSAVGRERGLPFILSLLSHPRTTPSPLILGFPSLVTLSLFVCHLPSSHKFKQCCQLLSRFFGQSSSKLKKVAAEPVLGKGVQNVYKYWLATLSHALKLTWKMKVHFSIHKI